MNNEKIKISQKDFTLVQQNHKIHDLKFETKPTTYMKDAMKRFVRNKSSVVAGIIIGILILLAIFVPIFNKNDITTSQNAYRFLPPRWPGFENSSVLNGQRFVEGIIVDQTDPDPEKHYPLGYDRASIVGEWELYEGLTNTYSPYASGGKILVQADSSRSATGIQTNRISADFGANEFKVEIISDESANRDDFELYVLVYYHGLGEDAKRIVLQPLGHTYGTFTTSDFSSIILANRPAGVMTSAFAVQIGAYVPPSFETTRPSSFYLNSLVVTNLTNAVESANPFAKHNFIEGNELLLRRQDSTKASLRYQTVISGTQSLFEGRVTRANFNYDFYGAIYGEKLYEKMGKSQLERYRDLGYIDFEFVDGDADSLKNTFVVLDEKKSPVLEVVQSYKRTQGRYTFYEYDVKVLNYRLLGYNRIPNFLFGTNQRGQDFFKIVFNGLRTSLMLGFGAAFINILIGLVWGAISGYYGGNIDLAMERFTDILGGIPWIVIMTLTILHLGNNFGVFLLALILTGWIGVSSITRSQFYRYKRREYVLASRTLGAKDSRLIFKHILPNSIGPIVTSAVMMIPGVIFSEATISYLGLGLQGLTSFGVALSEVQEYISTSPFLIVTGSIVIALLMISFNLFGNGLRDAFNPSLKGVD